MPNVANIAVQNIIQHTFTGQIGVHETQLVTRWEVIGLPVVNNYPQAIQDIDTGIQATWRTQYRACIPSDWTLLTSTTQRIAESETATPPVRSKAFTVGVNLAGTWAGAGHSDVASLAGAIQRFNYKAGKTEQGELRVGPISSLAVTGNQLSGALLTVLLALGTKLVSNVLFGSGGILAPVAWRRGTKAAPNQPSASLLFACAVGVNYSTMKRRKALPFGV